MAQGTDTCEGIRCGVIKVVAGSTVLPKPRVAQPFRISFVDDGEAFVLLQRCVDATKEQVVAVDLATVIGRSASVLWLASSQWLVYDPYGSFAGKTSAATSQVLRLAAAVAPVP